MPKPKDVDDFRRAPYWDMTIVGYNRLESLPLSRDYSKSLQATVHDALWMLTRQWQWGEFEAEDAGSALKAKVLADYHKMAYIRAGDSDFALSTAEPAPLEMMVERESLTADLALRIESGKLLKQIIFEYSPHDYPVFLSYFNLALLETSAPLLYNQIRKEPFTEEIFDSIKTKALDGFAAYILMNSWENTADVPPDLNAGNAIKIKSDFILQFEWLFGKPGNNMPIAWENERLEYQFSLSGQDVENSTRLKVDQYYDGSLDWYSFDINKVGTGAIELLKTFIPTSVTYEGMPKPRWWEMEDGAVNFGNINVKTTDLPTLLLIEFALIYGNDWLLIPYPMEVNTLCQIKGIMITDVFGYNTFIPAMDASNSDPWKKWALFRHGGDLSKTSIPSFYLAPTLLKSIENEPIESLSFLRDEMANLVWAFENIIPGALGVGQKSYELAQREASEAPTPTINQDTPLYFKLGSDVPFYQVPFLPVELKNDPNHMRIRLQKGRMPQGNNPRGVILNEVNYVREEEVPRSGIRVNRKWQRTRWINGATFQWIGREKETGKGEGNSGLQFDFLTYNQDQ